MCMYAVISFPNSDFLFFCFFLSLLLTSVIKYASRQAKIEARHKKVKPHLLQIKHTLDQYSTVFVKQGLMNRAIYYA